MPFSEGMTERGSLYQTRLTTSTNLLVELRLGRCRALQVVLGSIEYDAALGTQQMCPAGSVAALDFVEPVSILALIGRRRQS